MALDLSNKARKGTRFAILICENININNKSDINAKQINDGSKHLHYECSRLNRKAQKVSYLFIQAV